MLNLYPIHASGTLSGRFGRVNLNATTWAEAEAVAARYVASGTWASVPVAPIAPIPELPQSGAPAERIKDALDAFVEYCENRRIAPATLRKYKTFTKQFGEYCASRGLTVLGQLTKQDAYSFYRTWTLNPRRGARKSLSHRILRERWAGFRSTGHR